MGSRPITGWKRAALNVFIAVHVYIMVAWGLPESAFRNRIANPAESYVVYSGLWHSWGMFAPMPLTINFDVTATVKFKDGSTANWMAPRMQELPMWQRLPKERFRKWRERIRADDHMRIWDDTARWIARSMHTNKANPPIEVQLTRHWADIPPPDPKKDHQPMPKSFPTNKSYTYATIPISEKELQ